MTFAISTVAAFDVEQVRGVTVIRFTIDLLNEENFSMVADELDSRILPMRPRRVVVDLASIQQIDDLGLAMLQSFHDSIEELHGTAILCRLNSSVMGAMSLAGLNRLLHIRTSLNDAIWTF